MSRTCDLTSLRSHDDDTSDVALAPSDADVLNAIIAAKVNTLTRRRQISSDDGDDLRQELFLRIHIAQRKFDPAQMGPGGIASFHHAVVANATANLLRDRRAAKRAVQPQSLTAPAPGGNTPREQEIGSREYDRRRRFTPPDPEKAADLRLDVAETLTKLSPQDQAIARELMVHSVAEAARRLGMPASTLRDRMKRLRKPFENVCDFSSKRPSILGPTV